MYPSRSAETSQQRFTLTMSSIQTFQSPTQPCGTADEIWLLNVVPCGLITGSLMATLGPVTIQNGGASNSFGAAAGGC
jgi:hypothetical protein